MRMQQHEPEYSQGPAFASAQELMDWLTAMADDRSVSRRFRLAVAVCFDDEYRLGIGESALVAGEDRIPVTLDGSRMSLSLLGELMFRIPQPEQCGMVWMEGEWSPDADAPTMVVRRVGPLVDEHPDAIRPAVADLPVE